MGRDQRQRAVRKVEALSPEGASPSQVATDLTGRMQATAGPMRRRGSGQQDRGGMGTNLGRWPGLVVLCLQLKRSPTSKTVESNGREVEIGEGDDDENGTRI